VKNEEMTNDAQKRHTMALWFDGFFCLKKCKQDTYNTFANCVSSALQLAIRLRDEFVTESDKSVLF